MGFRTWTFKVKGIELAFKMEKGRAEEVARELGYLYRMHQHCRELSGIRGGEEHAWDTLSIFGPSGTPLRNPETYPADVDDFLRGLPTPITPENLPPILARRRELYELHVPIKDERQNPEEKAEADAERERITREREEAETAKDASIVAEWGSGERVPVPAGTTAVVLQQCYDDSDSMTDYYHPHASHGPAFVLAVVPGKPAETERLARDAVARYPNLLAVEWTWHTEKYSMGHGNHLTSTTSPGTTFEHPRKGPLCCHWEVQFTGGVRDGSMLTWAGYPGTGPAPTVTDGTPAAASGTPKLNTAKQGVEIHFAAKPSPEILERIKGAGWRWSRFSSCWYAKDSPRARAFAEALTGRKLGGNGNGTAPEAPDRFDLDAEDRGAEACGLTQPGR
mgnify:CR=1 FL=1